MAVDYTPSFDPADVDSDYGSTGGDITVPTFSANMKPFRFWCQRALPLVYDDSLSYYEVLCKVVDQMNGFLTDLQTATGSIEDFGQQFVVNQQFLNSMAEKLGQDVEDLEDYINDRMGDFTTAYQQLQTYVNTYFDNLDVQQEINNKLDEMSQDGTFNTLFDPLITAWMTAKTAQIDESISTQNQTLATQNSRLSVLEGRMDTFSSLPAGSTSGNAELLDIRTNFLGETFGQAGDAVRVSDLLASGFSSQPITYEWIGPTLGFGYFDTTRYKGGKIAFIVNTAYNKITEVGRLYIGNVMSEVDTIRLYSDSDTDPDHAHVSDYLDEYQEKILTSNSEGTRFLVTFSIPSTSPYQYIGTSVSRNLDTPLPEPDFIVYASNWIETPIDSTLTRPGEAADAKATGDAIKETNELVQTLVPTSDNEVNRIIKQLYIPSSVSLDLSAVYRVTIYNGAVNLYGFRFFDRNNTRLLDFTNSSSFTGLTKIGDVIAEIGDLTDIDDTSKNFYCSVYDSVLYQSQLVDAYNLAASDLKYTIAPEFSASTIYYAGYYVWHDNELRMFTKDHPAGAWIGTDTALATGFLTDLAHVVFMFAVPYDATKTYAVGDFCTLQNRYLYQCFTPITTPESFTAGHWKRVFFTNVYNDEIKLLHSTIISSNIELNKIVKRFYVPASKNIDVSTITRAVVFNGYLNMYGIRFYNGATMLINFTAGHYFEGYETINGFYGELGDYSDIVSSQAFTCKLYDSVYNENDIAAAYEASRSIKDNSSFGTYTPAGQTSQGNNIGTELTIASYNVAHYNDDVPSVIIPNEKIKNFIDAIGKINADILCVQEDNTYIDSNNVRTARQYLYDPQYPNETGTRETTVKSKAQPTQSGTLTYSNGRWLGYSVIEYGDNKVLAVSTHPIASVNGEDTAETIAARLTQYTELFKWINGDIDLNEIDISTGTTGLSMHVPSHTHVVIGMDANSLTEDDRTNLTNLAEEYGFVLGNGGRIGWIRTARSRFEWYSIDNIIVSDNVIINYFEALTSKYSNLYSDHVPVVARVTLT